MSKRKKLPKGWRRAKLETVADTSSGGTPRRSTSEYYGGDIPWIKSGELKDGIVEATEETITEEGLRHSSAKLLPAGTLMIAMYGATIGKLGISGIKACTNQAVCSIIPSEQIDREFLFFYLLQIRDDLVSRGAGGAQPNISQTIIRNLKIPLPPLAVQERIVEILQQADAIRRKRAEARRLADQILPALFLDMFGDPATNPKGWPVEPIGELVAFETSQIKPEQEKEYSYIAPEHIESGTGRFSGPHSILGRELGSSKNKFSAEHVLYCKLRPYLNKVILPESSGICSSELIPLRPLGKVSREFLAIYLRLPFFVAIATQKSQGTKMPRFGPSQMATEHMMVPPARLQHAFCETANQLSSCMNKAVDSQFISSGLFSGLLSRAFTGELTAEWEAENADWIAERQAFYERLPRLALLTLLQERHERAGRNAETLITALMKYIFLTQMEGSLHRRLYRFVPYHYGPCAMELYGDLEALANDGLIVIENDAEEDKTRIKLADPDRAAALLEEEAKKDDARLAAMDQSDDEAESVTDPVMPRLLRRRAEILETLRTDSTTVLDTYGDLDHNALLKTVYEKYPAYAKKSRVRKARKASSAGKKRGRRPRK